jgi:hypothetical protein
VLRGQESAQSIEYRSATWIEQNLPGARVMMAGSLGQWATAFTEVPQFTAQPYTTSPNWLEYLVVSGIDAARDGGDEHGALSATWLKAFGNQAIGVPGRDSPEFWKPVADPHKFDGLLMPVWRQNDTTIFALNNSDQSLAHVVRPADLVRTTPVWFFGADEVKRYVAAIEQSSKKASFRWLSTNRAVVEGILDHSDLISVQITYDPGWRATVNGSVRPIRSDGLGLMVVDAGCSGACEVALDYAGSTEIRFCRLVSLVSAVLLLVGFWLPT